LLTPLSESSGARSLTDLHKDLDTIFTSNTPPKFKSTPNSTPGIGSKTRKTEQLTPQFIASSSSAAAGLLSPCMPAMSRIKSLSRMSLLDVPPSGGGRNSGGSGGGDSLVDMYHTVSGDLMSASRPAIPFARITTTNRPRQQEVPEAAKAAPPAAKAERWDGGDTEWDSLQGLSEEVWRVSAPVCGWAGLCCHHVGRATQPCPCYTRLTRIHRFLLHVHCLGALIPITL
jgi:hypothetical protein